MVDYILRMAAGAATNDQTPPSRRRGLRYYVEAPLDVTILRSGIPDTLPGRSLNLGVGGLAAVLAGELSPGESVALEIRLPQAANPLRTRALVRHCDRLRCGMEFVGLTIPQRTVILEFAEKNKSKAARGGPPRISLASAKNLDVRPFAGGPPSTPPPPSFAPRPRGRGWIFFLASAAVLLGVLLWRWNRGWEDLESGLRENIAVPQTQAHVPADVMEKLIRHRVDPDYPSAARPEKLQGVIVLDVVVDRDGTVADVRALNGPEILAQSATDALRWWRFEPYRVDGVPVVAETTLAVEFKP